MGIFFQSPLHHMKWHEKLRQTSHDWPIFHHFPSSAGNIHRTWQHFLPAAQEAKRPSIWLRRGWLPLVPRLRSHLPTLSVAPGNSSRRSRTPCAMPSLPWILHDFTREICTKPWVFHGFYIGCTSKTSKCRGDPGRFPLIDWSKLPNVRVFWPLYPDRCLTFWYVF